MDTPFDPAAFLKTLTTRPGVYRMLDAKGGVIYVGKAANLKNRVASYFRATGQSPKTRVLVSQIHSIEITVTHNEGEALLLENNFIKELKPRYNIMYRDDKSYPYIYLSGHQDFPRLGFYRGARREEGRFFGPFPSAGAVRESLHLLQKIFPVRQCEDSFYRNRSRPCLQYQIKRCTAPCVGLVDRETYQQDVRDAVMFLEGKSQQVTDELVKRMETAAANLEFERAARLRDQIASLRRVQEKQYVSGESGDLDVVASSVHNSAGCVQVFYIRGGRNLGNKTFFPRHADDADAAEILAAFLPQYYLDRETPPEILINHELEDAVLLEQVLGEKAQRKVTITHRVRGERARWLEMAATNARHALAQYLTGKADMPQRYEALQEALGLDNLPQRLECFDISHTMGESAVASCVVFDANGPLKSDYRRFNIEDITPGDDYAALHQALTRRYTRLKAGEGKWPDVLLIDGGKGQVSAVAQALEELQVGNVVLVGVAKGPTRKAGLETLFLPGVEAPIILPADSPALHLIQQIRDEAHRFAITGHRQRRARTRTTSPLESIPGIGAKRRRQLLTQFGGLQGVARAGVEDLASVQGISKQLAQLIYDAFHTDKNV
ncbi:MAG: excinuclease ABC subunit UvrC [Gammaproteobacteria bacterium]|nr:excinuclease ABC subunit UvrC [Gammaproteobacteria bacterium]